jgi:hypothetical protein
MLAGKPTVHITAPAAIVTMVVEAKARASADGKLSTMNGMQKATTAMTRSGIPRKASHARVTDLLGTAK